MSKVRMRMRDMVEKTRFKLTTIGETDMVVDELYQGEDFSTKITREGFIELT